MRRGLIPGVPEGYGAPAASVSLPEMASVLPSGWPTFPEPIWHLRSQDHPLVSAAWYTREQRLETLERISGFVNLHALAWAAAVESYTNTTRSIAHLRPELRISVGFFQSGMGGLLFGPILTGAAVEWDALRGSYLDAAGNQVAAFPELEEYLTGVPENAPVLQMGGGASSERYAFPVALRESVDQGFVAHQARHARFVACTAAVRLSAAGAVDRWGVLSAAHALFGSREEAIDARIGDRIAVVDQEGEVHDGTVEYVDPFVLDAAVLACPDCESLSGLASPGGVPPGLAGKAPLQVAQYPGFKPVRIESDPPLLGHVVEMSGVVGGAVPVGRPGLPPVSPVLLYTSVVGRPGDSGRLVLDVEAEQYGAGPVALGMYQGGMGTHLGEQGRVLFLNQLVQSHPMDLYRLSR